MVALSIAAVTAASACASPETDEASPPPSGFSWVRGADMPTPRTEVAVAALEGKLYAAGGFTTDGSATGTVEVYDPQADAWSESPGLPVPLHHAGLASASGRLYVVGGYGGDGDASGAVWSWAPGEDAWRDEPPLPTPRGALAVAVTIGGQIHALGGATGFGGASALSPRHEVFDPADRAWSRLADLPDPRDHLAAAALGSTVYVVGGRKLSLTTNSSRLDAFDLESGEWSDGAAPMPTARGGLAAATAGPRIFVFGGEQPSGTFEEAEVYDQTSDAWTAAPPLPTPRHGLGAATVGDRIYVIGGGPTPGLSVSGATEILEVRS